MSDSFLCTVCSEVYYIALPRLAEMENTSLFVTCAISVLGGAGSLSLFTLSSCATAELVANCL